MFKDIEIKNYFLSFIFLIFVNFFFYFFSSYSNIFFVKAVFVAFFFLEIFIVLKYNLKIFKDFYIFFFFVYSFSLIFFSFIILTTDVAFRDKIDNVLGYNKLRDELVYKFNLKNSKDSFLLPGFKEVKKSSLIFK